MTITLPSGYTLTIDANGWSQATREGGVVAEGPLRLVNAAWFYDNTVPFNQPWLGTITASSISDGTVRHLYTGAVTAHVEYHYSVQGDDVLVEAVVQNLGASPLSPGFMSPRLLFADWAQAQATSANTLGYDQSHTRNVGPSLAYPSSNIPMAAAYLRTATATGLPINLCVYSREHPREGFMTVGAGAGALPGRGLTSWFTGAIPPCGSRTYKWAYRFCACSDSATLIGGYAAHVRAVRPIAYAIDRRPVAQFVSLNPSYVRPDNPFGYNDGGLGIFRRFDKPEGVADYVTRLVPKMQQAKCQGLLAWQLQGVHPRGVMYRPDFDAFPPAVLANMPSLISGFTQANLTIGLLSRPGAVITSTPDVTRDGLARQATDAPGLADLRTRVRWAITKGFRGFYLDSVMSEAGHHLILSAMRAEVGQAAGLFTEQSTALSLGESAGYLQLTYQNGQFVVSRAVRDLRVIYPDAPWLTKFTGALPPGGYAEVFDYFQAEHLTPLVEDQQLIFDEGNIPALLSQRSF